MQRAGVEQILGENGIEYFYVDTHLVDSSTQFTPYELLAGGAPVAVEMPPAGIASVAGTPVPIVRRVLLPDGSFLINFYTVNNVTYYVLYSEDMVTWKTSAQPSSS